MFYSCDSCVSFLYLYSLCKRHQCSPHWFTDYSTIHKQLFDGLSSYCLRLPFLCHTYMTNNMTINTVRLQSMPQCQDTDNTRKHYILHFILGLCGIKTLARLAPPSYLHSALYFTIVLDQGTAYRFRFPQQEILANNLNKQSANSERTETEGKINGFKVQTKCPPIT